MGDISLHRSATKFLNFYSYHYYYLQMASEILSNLQLGSIIFNATKINPLSANSGAFISAPSVTVTDSATAASGTLPQFNAHYLAAPTLAAANTGVTTTSANTLTIGGAPTAGANETLTNAYALNVLNGITNLAGAVNVGGTLVAPQISGLTTLNGNIARISSGIYTYANGTSVTMSANTPSGGTGFTFASNIFTSKAIQGTIASSFTLSASSPLTFTATVKAKYTLTFSGQFSSSTAGTYLIFIAPVTTAYAQNSQLSAGNYYIPSVVPFTIGTANQAVPLSTTLTLPMTIGDSFTLSSSTLGGSGTVNACVCALSVVAEAGLM